MVRGRVRVSRCLFPKDFSRVVLCVCSPTTLHMRQCSAFSFSTWCGGWQLQAFLCDVPQVRLQGTIGSLASHVCVRLQGCACQPAHMLREGVQGFRGTGIAWGHHYIYLLSWVVGMKTMPSIGISMAPWHACSGKGKSA